MNIKQLSLENRPRERLQQYGAGVLSPAELMAIILKSGTKKENVLDLAQRLLSKYKMEQLSTCTIRELDQEYGIGIAKACQIVALFELYRRLPRKKNELPLIRSAQDVAEMYTPLLQHLTQEQCRALYLDTKNKIIADEIITIGILNASLIHPREVFSGALRHHAHALIIIHNHPSGDPSPSEEDVEITERLAETGVIMGIPLLDHVILGHTSWWSWKEQNI
ncbi:TPA: JAB domain-containing protein [Candidatus Woesearchaeota archaeon]|nr:JAB domain-containing protein [Candidatus Woesearchaeota archaeon]